MSSPAPSASTAAPFPFIKTGVPLAASSRRVRLGFRSRVYLPRRSPLPHLRGSLGTLLMRTPLYRSALLDGQVALPTLQIQLTRNTKSCQALFSAFFQSHDLYLGFF